MNGSNPPPKLAVVGPGFWARFQVRAWRELEKEGLVQLVAVVGRDRAKAEHFLADLGIPLIPVYPSLEGLFDGSRRVDLVDLITTTPTHAKLAGEVLSRGIPVIVQKPMAQTLGQALGMVKSARLAGLPLLVHENFRWQRPFLELKAIMTEYRERLGPLIDLRLEWESGAEDFLRGQPYFAIQPFLVNGEVGVHLVDLIRFLAGRDVARISSAQLHWGIDHRYRGDDMAHVTLELAGGVTASYCAAFSAARRDERPPQTFATLTFQAGALELGPDYEITLTLLERNTSAGISRKMRTISAVPVAAPWTQDPALKDYQSWLGQWECCLRANRSYLDSLHAGGGTPRGTTTGEDNLNVLATVFGAYLAAKTDTRINIPSDWPALEALAERLDEARIGYPDYPSVTNR